MPAARPILPVCAAWALSLLGLTLLSASRLSVLGGRGRAAGMDRPDPPPGRRGGPGHASQRLCSCACSRRHWTDISHG
ncbi:hypothetical protein DFH94DRAFT_733536 [Russula ochroleuca]|uniref:Uncharacterized protein n=1 Tax=Russula ochroleuca TaxID=152965 RepID=A0A9P5MYQ5_9AGAM|nr:hypothetical protein DFH94DRAFT_733536 [Russula ochroleuca]